MIPGSETYPFLSTTLPLAPMMLLLPLRLEMPPHSVA